MIYIHQIEEYATTTIQLFFIFCPLQELTFKIVKERVMSFFKNDFIHPMPILAFLVSPGVWFSVKSITLEFQHSSTP